MVDLKGRYPEAGFIENEGIRMELAIISSLFSKR